ncbi:MAG: hypothetical protein LBL67_02025 [Coriobacteriales bacterium]|jgi:hypothetical protein|nr:hypothetical protein [Coriobacteriales bacterium]
MSQQEIEHLVGEVNATLAIEGLPLKEKEKDDLRSILSGQATYESVRKRLIAQYRQPAAS